MAPSSTITPQTLSAADAATYIGMSQSYLAASRRTGVIAGRTPAPKFIRIGRTIRFRKTELDVWLNNHQDLEFTGQS